MASNLWETARKYTIELSLAVIPLCDPEHKCVSQQHHARCQSTGKAPLIKDWQQREVPTMEELHEWEQRWPLANIGLNLGYHGLVAIDVAGRDGEKKLSELSGGDLPQTWEFTTGKGRRLIYSTGREVRAQKRRFQVQNGELELLGPGQQTVLPPSVHPNGKIYTWVPGRSPWDCPVAPAPSWLVQAMSAPVEPGPASTTERWEQILLEPITEGARNETLTSIYGYLLAKGVNEKMAAIILHSINHSHCVPPLPDRELLTIIKSITERERRKRQDELQRAVGNA